MFSSGGMFLCFPVLLAFTGPLDVCRLSSHFLNATRKRTLSSSSCPSVPHCPWTLPPVFPPPIFKPPSTLVDWFSKVAHFISLFKIPAMKDTAKLVLQHVVRLHCLPTDIVSDQGAQFTSTFWKESCGLLGASVRHSSCFHPQSNVQTERKNQDLETTLFC